MGCRVCRARKVKCDGRPNGCRNCERLQLECVADDGSTPNGNRVVTSPVSLKKIRTYRSCQSCRLSKTKCNGARPKCSRCAAKLINCVYDGGSVPRWTRNLNKSQAASASADDDDDDDDSSSNPAEHDRSEQSKPDEALTKLDNDPGEKLLAEADAPRSSMSGQMESHPLSWLLLPGLPTSRDLRRVVEQYFSNVHPLRCFAFVHKPSFMRQLDKGFASDDEQSALLHVICAHGAKFLVLGSSQGDSPPPPFLRNAGNQWAKRAEHLMLANFGRISVQRLMTAILLHDFHFRQGEYGQALMISGLAVRMAHALKINTEYSPDVLCAEQDGSAPSVASRESRRRLMWACYILDAWAGSGVDQLTLLRENDIKIQLPTNERNFGLRIAAVTETLGVGHVLQFLPPAVVPRRPAANMGIMAYYVRAVALWKRIVRYVGGLRAGDPPPWQPDSLFAALDADLALWRRELPDFVEYSAETIYARLDSNQLGALVSIHCTHHHNYLELYKLTMPDLFFKSSPKPLVFPPEHHHFLRTAHVTCFHHARQIADILAEAAEHGSRLLSDSLLPFFVYDSSRVMLYYAARLLDPAHPDAESTMMDAVRAVESNNRILRMMSALFPISSSLSSTIERWLSKMQVARDDLLTSLEDHQLISKSPYLLPPLLLPDDRPRSASFSTQNPHAGGPASWDGTSVAANHAQPISVTPSLQHERPVPPAPHPLPMCGALDLDDLQSFLSWDMYGIMEMGGSVSNDDLDDSALSWSGAV